MKKSLFILLLLFQHCICNSQDWINMGFTINRPPRTLYTDTISNLMYIGGGGFTYLDTSYVRGIAYWDGTTYHKMGYGIDFGGTPGNVLSIKRYNNDIYVGGAFTAAGNQYSPNIAKWDGSSWSAIGANGSVEGMVAYNNELYVCGTFDSIAGIAAHGVAKYDGSGWVAINCPANMNSLSTIEIFNNTIYVGGIFSDSTGSSAQNIAQFNGSRWVNVGAGIPGLFASLFKLKVYHGDLYAMGRFYIGDGNPSASIMKWDGVSWLNTGNGVGGINPTVTSCTILNDELYIGGSFLSAGNIPANKIVSWDGTRWCASYALFNNNIDAIEVYNGQLIAGGGFTKIDGDTMYYMAKYVNGNFMDTCSINYYAGIEQLSNNAELTIYPNPASDQLTIELPDFLPKSSIVSIKNVIGQTLQQISISVNEKKLELDVSGLSQGIYFIQLQTKDGIVSKKFIKD